MQVFEHEVLCPWIKNPTISMFSFKASFVKIQQENKCYWYVIFYRSWGNYKLLKA